MAEFVEPWTVSFEGVLFAAGGSPGSHLAPTKLPSLPSSISGKAVTTTAPKKSARDILTFDRLDVKRRCHQGLGVGMLRAIKNVLGLARLNNFALTHDQYLIA